MTVTAPSEMVAGLGEGVACGRVAGWELVEAAAGGDREAFGRICDQHAGAVFGFVVVRLGDRALAEDITAETFLRALRGISTVQYQGRGIRAWLITIARNLIRDHVKSHRYRFDSVVAEVPEPSLAPGGPGDLVVAQSAASELMRAVAGLDGAQRDCIMLRFFAGLSVTETAAALNRTPTAVKGLQHRALRRFAQLLEEK